MNVESSEQSQFKKNFKISILSLKSLDSDYALKEKDLPHFHPFWIQVLRLDQTAIVSL